MIKAIFFDIDGTLLSHKTRCVPESTKNVLNLLKQQGNLIFAATGRHMLELKELPLQDLPFDGYVTLNGHICLDARRKVLYDVPLAKADVEKMRLEFNKKEVPIMMIEKERMYINFVNDAVRDAQKAISTPVPNIGRYEGDDVYQFIVFGDRNRVSSIVAQIPNCKMNGWNPYAFDVILKIGGKVAGIQKMLNIHHIKKEEIMAFGDGDNDIDMLRFAGIGVAMGNADAEVKACADYVTAETDADGIQKALEHYGVL